MSDIASKITRITNERDTQTDLIAQIKTALEGKTSVSLAPLSNPATAANILSGYQAYDANKNALTGTFSGTNISYTMGTFKSGNTSSPRTNYDGDGNISDYEWYKSVTPTVTIPEGKTLLCLFYIKQYCADDGSYDFSDGTPYGTPTVAMKNGSSSDGLTYSASVSHSVHSSTKSRYDALYVRAALVALYY